MPGLCKSLGEARLFSVQKCRVKEEARDLSYAKTSLPMGRLCKVNRFRGSLIWCCSAIRNGGPGGTLAVPVSQFDRLLGRAFLLPQYLTSKDLPWQAKFIQVLIESFDERLAKVSVNTRANRF